MRWGYILGPLILLPLVGAFFLIPQPKEEDGRLRFDRASLSLLECHVQAAAFFAFGDDEPADPLLPPNRDPAVRVER